MAAAKFAGLLHSTLSSALCAPPRKEFGADPLGSEVKNAPRSAPSADDVQKAMRSLAHD